MHRSKTASLFNDLLVEDSEAVLAILIAREYPQRHRTKPFNRCLPPTRPKCECRVVRVTAALWGKPDQRSPPSLLTIAACGGLRSTPDCRPRRAFLHLSYSYAAPCGPALLVTQCHFQTHAVQQQHPYSITSSARPSSVIGKVMPSALAVLRLMISSTLLTC